MEGEHMRIRRSFSASLLVLFVACLSITAAVSGRSSSESGSLTAEPHNVDVSLSSGDTLTTSLTLSNGNPANITVQLERLDCGYHSTDPAAPQQGEWLYSSSPGVPACTRGAESAAAHPGAYLWTQGQLQPPSVLVYSDDPIRSAPDTSIDQALRKIGWAYKAHYDADFSAFEADLAGGKWDLVVFAAEKWLPPESTLEALNGYASSGGKLIVQDSAINLNPEHALWKTMGLRWVEEICGDQPFSVSWAVPDNPIFNSPNSLASPSSFAPKARNCYRHILGLLSDAQSLAVYGSKSSSAGSPAIISGNSGRTVFKGFSDSFSEADRDGDGIADTIELWENLLVNVRKADATWLAADATDASITSGQQRAVNLTFDATGLTPGAYRAQLRVSDSNGSAPLIVPVVMNVTPAGEPPLASTQPSLDLGTASGALGARVSIPMTLAKNGAPIAATSMDITYDASIVQDPTGTISLIAKNAGKSLMSSTPSPGVFRVGVVGLNQTLMPDGVIATISFTINPETTARQATLGNTPSASTASGALVSVTGATGAINIPQIWTINASAGPHGTINPAGAVPVNDGASQIFNITPDTGYHIVEVLVDGSPIGPQPSYTFTNVTGPGHTISATFDVNTYTITPTAGAGGSTSPSGATTVSYGQSLTVFVNPDSCHSIADVKVDGVSQGALPSYSFNNITNNHSLAASFNLNTYSIVSSSGPGGAITPAGSVSVNCGTDQAFTLTPNTGYHVADLKVDGASVGAQTGYTFRNVTGPHTIEASFAINTYTIYASAGPNGSIDPAGSISVDYGTFKTFNIIPNTGYHVADVLVDGSSVGPQTTYTFPNVTAGHTISAAFALNTLTLTATAGSGGSITPPGTTTVGRGSSQTFYFLPDPCYRVADVVIDGSSIGARSSYTFTNITTDHTISASFVLNSYTLTSTAGPNGTIAPLGQTPVACGEDQFYNIVPRAGYHVSDVRVDGKRVGPIETFTFTGVGSNHSIKASFAINIYSITATAGPGGVIRPSGSVRAISGSTKVFTIVPANGKTVADVIVDGVSVGAVRSYTFRRITDNHWIYATFR